MTRASCLAASTLIFSSWLYLTRPLERPFSTTRADSSSRPRLRGPGPGAAGDWLKPSSLLIRLLPRAGSCEGQEGGGLRADWSRDRLTQGQAASSLSAVYESLPCPSVPAFARPLSLPRPSLRPRPFFSHCRALEVGALPPAPHVAPRRGRGRQIRR